MTDPLYSPAPDSLAGLLVAARKDSRVPMPAGMEYLRWLTLPAAAVVTGLSPSSLGRYESGSAIPPLPVLRGILVAYQSSPEVCAECEAAWVDARPALDRGTP